MRGPLVVLGDSLLDVDVTGTAGRLCPDAPAPVLEQAVERPRPGGAALAAQLAAASGAEVVLVTALADDEPGHRVRELLDDVEVVALPHDGTTPVKRRVRSAGQTLLRLDSGGEGGCPREVPESVATLLSGAGAVLVSDYGRGVSAAEPLRRMLASLPRRTPLVWDPHPRGPEPVPGVRLATPNRGEARRLSGAPAAQDLTELAQVERDAVTLMRAWQAQAVAVTLGERGALLSYGDGSPMVVPGVPASATDPCGAGDCFAATAARSLGEGALTVEAVGDAVRTAGQFVRTGGASGFTERRAATVGEVAHRADRMVAEVAARGGTVVATGGCFDLLHAGHVATLEAARGLGDVLVVCLNSDASVRRLKGEGRPLVGQEDRKRVLEALGCVDAVVVFDEDTPVEAIRRLRPHVWAKGGDYSGTSVPEAAVLAEWGGQAVVLPYLEGRSTTRLVATAAERGGS